MHKCPFDKSHIVKRQNLPYHIVKCRENHPHSKIKICRYNVNHYCLRSEIEEHEKNCPNRGENLFDVDEVFADIYLPEVENQGPPDLDEWDFPDDDPIVDEVAEEIDQSLNIIQESSPETSPQASPERAAQTDKKEELENKSEKEVEKKKSDEPVAGPSNKIKKEDPKDDQGKNDKIRPGPSSLF